MTSTESTMRPKFSAGENESKMAADANHLLESQWRLDDEQRGLEKRYYFKTYTKALDFLQIVGIRSKSEAHHSVMTIRAGSVDVHWTTHNPRGLSAKDVYMAHYCDEQASLIGAVKDVEAFKCAPLHANT